MPQVYTGDYGTEYDDIAPGNMLEVGIETMPRLDVTTAVTPSSGQLRPCWFTARKNLTSTQVRVCTGSVAAGATPTLCRIGLWEVAGNGAGTLIASTANDTTLFAAATSTYTRPWTAPVTLQLGQRYAFGVLVVTAATMPNFSGKQLGGLGTETAMPPRLSGSYNGLSDLPASFSDADFAQGGLIPYGVILP